LKDFEFIFELYHGMKLSDILEIFRAFPFILCLPTRKVQLFMGQFKKYRFTHDQIKHVCTKSGGVLGCKVGNFRGLFDILLQYGISAKDTKKILDICPEFALQNRKDLFRRKIELIKWESGKNPVWIRNFIRRHPDILMKSWASLETKISYIQRNLSR